MTRVRYRIEASLLTLQRFVNTLAPHQGYAFVEKINTDSTEEFYYVFVNANRETHEALRTQRFTDTRALPAA